jgi:ERCC4-type nuclease
MGMVTVVVDTREQEPYGFDSESVASIRKALPAGDYSIEGFETRVAVKRKSMADFVSTVIRGRKRFHKELEKLRHYDAACVVVEANYRDVLGACYQSDALIGTIASIIIDQDIQLAYALTIHKTQGSEFPCAVVVVHKAHSFMHHRNLLYTGVTRARKSAIVLGDRWGIRNCAKKCQVDDRKTFLSILLNNVNCPEEQAACAGAL